MGIGYRIKELREFKKLKQADLAKLVGVTPSAIGNYENEVSHPKVDILYKICDVLKCDANYLFQDVVKISDSFILNTEETNLVTTYRSLSSISQEIVSTTFM